MEIVPNSWFETCIYRLEKEREAGCFHASELWNCPRRLILSYLGYKINWPLKVLQRMALGQWLHRSLLEDLVQTLNSMYSDKKLESEVSIDCPQYKIKGTADLILTSHAEPSTLIELKTVVRKQLSPSWIYQVEAYSRCLEPQEPVNVQLWLLNRITGDLEVFYYKQDNEIWNNILKKIALVEDCLETNQMPPMAFDPTFEIKEISDCNCQTCPLYQSCILCYSPEINLLIEEALENNLIKRGEQK